MGTHVGAMTAVTVLIAVLAAAPVLYAHSQAGGMGMMGQGMTGGMMMGRGSGNGTGIMNMMGQGRGMARNCSGMMGNGGAAPNAQWQRR